MVMSMRKPRAVLVMGLGFCSAISAVDAAVAMRARPADFACWAKRGIEGWSWDEARDH